MAIQAPRYDTSLPESPRVLAWQDEVAKSIAQSTSSEPQHGAFQTAPAASAPPNVIVNHIVTTPAPPVVVTRVRAEEPKQADQISTRTFVGTVLGAAAGGLIMYAISKGDEQSTQQPEPQKIITYRTIEAPPAQGYSPFNRTPEFKTYSKRGNVVNSGSGSRPIPIKAPLRTHNETTIPRSEYSHDSRNGDEAVLSNGSRRLAAEPRPSRTSQVSSSQRTVRQADLIPLPPSAPATEVRSARNVPLPYSVATSRASRDKERAEKVVSPHDSISQVSTKRSKASGKSKHHREEDEHRSSRGSKAGSKNGSSSRVSGFKVMGERGSISGF